MKSKKFLLVMLISCIAMVGCATQNSKGQNYQEPDYPDEIEAEPPSGLGFDLTNEDVFESGYFCIQYDTFSSADIFFESTNTTDSDVEWSVYIVDNELSSDGVEKMIDTQEPVAVNEGSAGINGGQWIYVFCNVNSKTASEPTNSSFKLYSFRDYI